MKKIYVGEVLAVVILLTMAIWISCGVALTLILFMAPNKSHAQGIGFKVTDLSQYALISQMPTAGTSAPPCIGDTSVVGTAGQYAPANHTHCSKIRKDEVTTATDGTVTVTFSTVFNAVPRCVAQAIPTAGTTDVINVQTDGEPTVSQAKFRVTHATPTANGLLGLIIPVLASTPGATKIAYACFEP